MNLFKLCSL